MKNIYISLFCLFTFLGFSQMSLTKLDGTPINNGDLFSFISVEEPDNYLGIKILNNSSNDINVKAKIENITNASGTSLQLCFGDVCLASLIAGNSYPNFPAIIPANGSNGNFDHFLNTNVGIDPNLPVEYSFKFYQVDENDQEIGNSVSFSYRYSATLSNQAFTNSLNKMGIDIKTNVINNLLQIDALKATQLSLYDLNGKMFLNQSLSSGNNQIDLSFLGSSTYVASFTNNDGLKGNTKIIKK